MYNINKREDLAEIYRLLEASEEGDEEFRDKNFENESDIVEEREEGSETEEEGSSEDEAEIEENSDFYMGKDKVTKWYKIHRQSKVRRRPQNIMTLLPGVIGAAKTPVEFWNCLCTEDILNDIVKYTNQYIDNIKEAFSRERDAKHKNLVESIYWFILLGWRL